MSFKVAIIQGKEPDLSGVGGASESDLSTVLVDFISPGARDAASFRVDPPGASARQVVIKVGRIYVPNAAGTMVYCIDSDSDFTRTLATNASGNPRISAIVLKLDRGTTPNNLADNVVSIIEVQGTPAVTPVAPNDAALQTAVGAGNVAYRLANVQLSAGYTTVTAPNITDTRSTASLEGGKVKHNSLPEASQVVKSSYSTSEVNTGAKWVDGKDIYKKTVNFGALPNSGGKNVAHGISGIDYVVSLAGVASNGSGDRLAIPYPGAAYATLSISGSNVAINTATDRSPFTTCYVTLYYTKT